MFSSDDTESPQSEIQDNLLKILFVDDDEWLLSVYRKAFKRQPYKPLFAADGAQALAILHAEPVDVLVTDIRMPEVDGFELISLANKKNLDLIIIALSGEAEKEDVIRLFNDGGIDAYLDKPCNMDVLKQRITHAVRKRDFEKIAKTEIHDKLIEYRQIAGVDELTMTAAPQKIEAFLLTQIETARRYDVPFSILLMELDNSEWIIERHGQDRYNELLRQAAKLIQKRMRVLDLLGRWEDSRMIMVSPHTDLRSAMIFAEDIRALIEHHDFECAVSITASLGVCAYMDKQIMRYELIANSYKALLAAQDTGGNAVITLGGSAF